MVAVFPDWVMLDRFVFCRDANTSLPEKDYPTLRAKGTTFQGVDFDIALCLADPPCTSRLYVLFPSDTDPVIACNLVAAHGNHFLFGITDFLRSDELPGLSYSQDHFICGVTSPDQPLLLQRLPMCTEPLIISRVNGEDITMQRLLLPDSAGLLCFDQVFAVAQLDRIIQISDSNMLEAELSVLKSDGKDDGAIWEVKRLPILCPKHKELDTFTWITDTVFPFKNYICWVDYYMGGILFFDVFEERPKVSYHELPSQGRSHHPRVDRPYLEMYRGVSVTDEGRLLKFVHVERDDGKLFGPSDSGYTITSHTLKITEDGSMWWVEDASMKSEEVLLSVRTNSDFNILTFPLVSMDKAHLVHFLYSVPIDDGIDNVSVVTIDMNTKSVLSTDTYIKGDQDRSREDADMYEDNYCNPKGFLATKFPRRSISRKRKILDQSIRVR